MSENTAVQKLRSAVTDMDCLSQSGVSEEKSNLRYFVATFSKHGEMVLYLLTPGFAELPDARDELDSFKRYHSGDGYSPFVFECDKSDEQLRAMEEEGKIKVSLFKSISYWVLIEEERVVRPLTPAFNKFSEAKAAFERLKDVYPSAYISRGASLI